MLDCIPRLKGKRCSERAPSPDNICELNMKKTDSLLPIDETHNTEATNQTIDPHKHSGRSTNLSPIDGTLGAAGSVPEMKSGGFEHDAFLLAMERDLPTGYVWLPETGLIHRSNDESAPTPLCGPIRIMRLLRTPTSDQWSWHLAFLDRDGNLREEIAPIAEIKENPRRLAKTLSGCGFDLQVSAAKFQAFISAWVVESRGRIATRCGWLEPAGNKASPPTAYTLPNGVICSTPNETGNSVTFTGAKVDYSPKGSLEGWQKTVAALAIGNPALMFAICVPLAAPLLRFSNVDTMGFNFYAKTSSGKTHALKAAASCGYDPDKISQWNATAAGLEVISSTANDGLLTLDEFPHRPGKAEIEALYSIGNGTGRTRATGGMGLSQTVRWRTALLSTSEKPLAQMFADARMVMPEGIGMRLLDIPAQSWTYGLLKDIHGLSDGHVFLLALSQACREHHGHVLPKLIDNILLRDRKIINLLPQMLAHYRSVLIAGLGLPNGSASGQIYRGIERFALVAAAGEIAIAKGLLPWPRGAASNAAQDLARLWYKAFMARQTPGASELISIVRNYLTKHIGQFIDLETEADTSDECGQGWKDTNWIYLQSHAFDAQILTGEPTHIVTRHLAEARILVPGSEARSLQYKMPGRLVHTRPRVYRLRRAAIFE